MGQFVDMWKSHAYLLNTARTLQDRSGQTPLHWASAGRHTAVARMLVEHSADTISQDKDGRTPLHLASKMGDIEVLAELPEYSAVGTAYSSRRVSRGRHVTGSSYNQVFVR